MGKRLEELLSESDEIDAEYSRRKAVEEKNGRTAAAKVTSSMNAAAELSATTESHQAEETSRTTRQKEVKRDKVERMLADFKQLLSNFCKHTGRPVILAVDDFYFIRRVDQPPVIDYVHRICKDTEAFVKLATIRHRTDLSSHGPVTRGVVLGHEIQPIDLELPLSNFDSITQFLQRIWRDVCGEVGVADPMAVFMGDGFRQAVLASGGVPRDFFGIIRAAIVIARERQEAAIGKLRVNEAARQYAEETKIPEFSVDISGRLQERDLVLFDVTRFARDTKQKNCFHVNIDEMKDNAEMRWFLDSLVDSRLLHLITDNTSNSRRAGRFAAFLLDVGLYAYPQRRAPNAVEEIEFWERDDVGRLKNLERSPVYRLRSIKELKEAASAVQAQNLDIVESLLPREEPAQRYEQVEILFPPQEEVE